MTKIKISITVLALINLAVGACSPVVFTNEKPLTESPPVTYSEQAYGGLYLFSPLNGTDTYLMNEEGIAVYTWESNYSPGNSVYLLENGILLRTGTVRPSSFDAGGVGGIVQEIAPDGTVIWEYKYANESVNQHHDIKWMPNGNILMIAWERKTKAEATAAGRDARLLKNSELWSDHIIELDPTNNQIVWEWHVWDHLVQDFDPSKENFGLVADHSELINLNYSASENPRNPDWNHINAIDYNAELDQILLSVRNFSEIWIIDHSTTTEEAVGHIGGNSGRGGDLLYRWGNPQAYNAGNEADRQYFNQHNAQWIPSGYPGAGNILVFNNGDKLLRPFSSVDEIVPPVNTDGNYMLVASAAYGPDVPVWRYAAENPTDFFADHISGAQRLSNGNTLICDGLAGIFFEVTPEQDVVWRYDYGGQVFRVNKYSSDYLGFSYLDLQPTIKLIAD